MNKKHSRGAPVPNRRLRLAINQLEYAIAAADHGSIRRAAEALSIKQSTLSRSIRVLEHTFGVDIFERSTGGVRATAAGRRFLRVSRSIVDQLNALTTLTRASGRGEAGHLVVGFCTSLIAGNLRATLLDFRNQYPQVKFATIQRSRTALITALRNGVIDVHVISGEALPSDCKSITLWSERVVAVLPNSHSLAVQDVIYWTDLQGQTVLLSRYDPGLEFETLLKAKLLVTNNRPQIERHDVSLEVIKSLINMGLGISLVLESDIGGDFSGLVYRELRDGTGPSRISFSAIWRKDNENPVLANFIGLLSERYPLFPEPKSDRPDLATI